MDKLSIGNSNNSKYKLFLEEVVVNHVVNPTLFESAVFFIASAKQILSFSKVGFIPASMIESMDYFQSHFTSENLTCVHNQSMLLAVPFSNAELSNYSLYIGVIINSQLEKVDRILAYIEGLATGLNKSEQIVKKETTTIHLKSLLNEADYQIEFAKLTNALVTCYAKQEKGSGQISIVEKQDDHFVPLFSPLDWEAICFDESDVWACAKGPYTEEPILIKNNPMFGNDYLDHVVFSVYVDEKTVSLLIFSFLSEWEAISANEAYAVWINDVIPLLQRGYIHEMRVQEGQRRDILLQVTKTFHSTMNIGALLEEIVAAIETAYPHYLVHLLLSLEWEVSDELPIKPLMYGADSGNRIAEHAYLTGQIQVDEEMNKHHKILYAPLRGKQGVYGVMEIQTPAHVHLPRYEIDFIEMLADIGGNALENAELYQQSRNLIHDLQLINETSHQLNLNLRLADTINFMTRQIIESFEADQVGFIMFHANGESLVLDGSTSFFMSEETLTNLKPFIRKVKREKDPVYIGDTHLQDDIHVEGYRSVLSVPMIQNNEIIGMVLTVHRHAYHFTFENFKLLQSLIHHSTLAFTNSMLHEELERLVITDHLTRLYSRNHLDERIQESMNQEVQGTFLLLDIDNFKQINDSYGHQAGDDIIIQVANIIKKNIRDEDIAARWGGEELAVYLPKVEVEIGQRIAKRIVRAVAAETSPKVTVSIGVSYWYSHDANRSLKRLFSLADKALYEAKETGKNQVIINSSMKK